MDSRLQASDLCFLYFFFDKGVRSDSGVCLAGPNFIRRRKFGSVTFKY